MGQVSYDRFAEAYDWDGSLDFSRKAFRRLTEICAEFGIRPGRHLDLGCGTGTLALLMAGVGWEVIGLDRSSAMLAKARGKANGSDRRVTFLLEDMRRFQLQAPVHLVTSFYDTVNHLLAPEDLAATLTGAARALARGGLLVFDVNTEAAFTRIWGGVTHFIESPEAATVYALSYDAANRLARGTVTGFLRRGGSYERFQEEIVERYWPPEAIEQQIEAAGLQVVRYETFNPFPLGGPGDLKWLWVARKEQ